MALVRLGRKGTLGRGLKPFMHLPMLLGSAKVKLGLGSGVGQGLILLVPQAANLDLPAGHQLLPFSSTAPVASHAFSKDRHSAA